MDNDGRNGRLAIAFVGLLFAIYSSAAFSWPTQAEIFTLNESIVQVIVENSEGNLGTGSGVVVNNDYVATNCHVLANARGVNITKHQENYRPVALRADWKHDLCLLKFDGLPFKSIPMVDSSRLKYEEPVFSISYPNDTQVPQTSYGNIKALYPFDDSLIIRSSAAFSMGSSGGALFDEHFNLVGITTFKSPGRSGYFYSLPVEWIRKLFVAPDIVNLVSTEDPFWSWPDDKKPYFMQVVIPLQRKKWDELERVSTAWSQQESKNADAWYYLGLAEYHRNDLKLASSHLAMAIKLNQLHLGALSQTALIAHDTGDKAELERLLAIIQTIDPDEADALNKQIAPVEASLK